MRPHEVYIETHLGGGAVMRNKCAATCTEPIEVMSNIVIEIDPVISSFFDLCQHNAWWIIILFTCAGGLSQFLNNRIGSPDIWRVVQHILDQYREEVFGKDEDTKEDAEHFHRITTL